ncbi:MAG TPA: hypothetical protein VFN35_11055, partial [Ktedonobacteraceae bacterium]|nr:hypothetical protein [Ktedonobacteraceae bacterium]
MTILPATRTLIDLARRDSIYSSLADAYEATIARFGTREDAQALLEAFLEDPSARACMLPPIRVLGDGELAHELFLQSVHKGKLRDEMPEGVLLCLGYMGYVQAEPLLWQYVAQKGDFDNYNYDYVNTACLGLLHLPCLELKEAIVAEITAQFGKNWW